MRDLTPERIRELRDYAVSKAVEQGLPMGIQDADVCAFAARMVIRAAEARATAERAA